MASPAWRSATAAAASSSKRYEQQIIKPNTIQNSFLRLLGKIDLPSLIVVGNQMSEQQYSDLKSELSQQFGADERMLLDYEIRFWKQRAWRSEQQRDREVAARKIADAKAEKYKDIPQERLDALLLEIKHQELHKAMSAAESYIRVIGLTNLRKLQRESDDIENLDDRISFWKNVADNYVSYAPRVDEELCDTN